MISRKIYFDGKAKVITGQNPLPLSEILRISTLFSGLKPNEFELSYIDSEGENCFIKTQSDFALFCGRVGCKKIRWAISIERKSIGSTRTFASFSSDSKKSDGQSSKIKSSSQTSISSGVEVVKHEVSCDGCGALSIFGTRYRCITHCSTDLCESCEGKSHPHLMLRIPKPVLETRLLNLLNKIKSLPEANEIFSFPASLLCQRD